MKAMAKTTVRGGSKIARFLEAVGDPRVTDAILARATATVMRRSVLPRVRAATPFRTGRLRNSLRIVIRGSDVQLRARFYWHFIKVGQSEQSLAEYAIDIVNQNREQLRQEIRLELRRTFGL